MLECENLLRLSECKNKGRVRYSRYTVAYEALFNLHWDFLREYDLCNNCWNKIVLTLRQMVWFVGQENHFNILRI